MRLGLLRIVLATVLLVPSLLSAQEWTRFRGPNGTGISDVEGIPAQWTDKDYAWKVQIPGTGHSHPVLWGEKLFVTSAVEEGNSRLVLCLNPADGSTIWQKAFPSQEHHKHNFNSFASSTPAVDADHVYLAWTTPESYTLQALDHQGKEVWTRDLGPFTSQHSGGTSPVVFEDMVILGNEQDAESFILAVDRKTGQDRWRTPRDTAKVSYATPMVYEPKTGPTQLVFNSQAHGVYGVEARTGKQVWFAKAFDKRTVASPVEVAGMFIGSCGSGGGGNYLVAVPPGMGDMSAKIAYKLDRSTMVPYVPTPVTSGDLLFLISDKGIASCVDGKTGEIYWQERLGGNFFGSPIRVGDRIYGISVNGECIVLAAKKEYELLGRNPLGEESHSTPAVANGRMYLRTFGHLIAVGGK